MEARARSILSEDRARAAVRRPLRLKVAYQARVWGGHRLAPGPEPIGEAWIVYEGNRIAAGPAAGVTLAELVAAAPDALLGRRVVERSGTRFPLLIKLLDTNDWLSLQVHPDDRQAARLEGAGYLGKTEAWHILEAEPGARVIAGLREGTTAPALARAIRDGSILDHVVYLPVRAGDTIFTPAGTIHALGPGLLLYEVQQTSDITYRVFDWNRPQSAGRTLHIAQSLEVVNPAARGVASPAPELGDGECRTVSHCEFFCLDVLRCVSQTVAGDTAGATFHALTVVEGAATVSGEGWAERLERFESIVIPAGAGAYTARPAGAGFRALRASIA